MATIVGLSPVWATQQFFRDDGTPFNDGRIYTYINVSNEQYPTWADSTGEVANTNPIVLDSSGRMQTEMWLQAGNLYALVLRENDGELLEDGSRAPGTEVMRARNVATTRLLAGANITLDPPSGVGPNVKITAAGSIGTPLGRGQSYLFTGQNSSGQHLTAGGGNFSAMNFTTDTVPVPSGSSPVVTYTGSGNFSFATEGTYIVQITTNIATLQPAGYDAWPSGTSVYGAIFGSNNKSYHTRYSASTYDGLDPVYQQATFTDEFYVSQSAGSSVKFSVYLNNGDGVSIGFDTQLTVVITRIGPAIG